MLSITARCLSAQREVWKENSSYTKLLATNSAYDLKQSGLDFWKEALLLSFRRILLML